MKEVKINSIVSNILGEFNYSHCRLCLKVIAEEFVRFEDLFALDKESATFQPMKDILSYNLGLESEIKEIPGIDAICPDCAGKTIESAQFINQCRRSTELLNNVFDNLYDALNIDNESIDSSQKMFVTCSEHETRIILMDEESQQSNKQRKKSNNFLKNKQLVCSECNEDFTSIQEMRAHNISHHSHSTCEECLETFPDNIELDLHVSLEHKYKCEECSQFRSTKESLKDHCDKAHRAYMCKDCGKSCKGTDRLHAHEQYHNAESNECPKCGKKYQTRSFFLNHTKLCLEGLLDPHPTRSNLERPFSCEKCGKRYSTSGGLRVHMRFTHGNAKHHVCDQCGKKFTAPSCLKTHMVTHTGEKNFPCNICNRKFVSKEALLYHTRRHTGEKPYSCNVCQERFVNASARAEHIKYKHIGPKLQCEICSRMFVTSYFLRKHMELHHDPRSKLYHMVPGLEPIMKINNKINILDY